MSSNLELSLPKLILPSVFDDAQTVSLRGHVDVVDEISGIEGWALDQSDLNAVIPIDICLGEQVVESVNTGGLRNDISEIIGADVAPGFRFGPAVMRLIAAQAEANPDSPLRVRIGGTRLQLATLVPLPTATRVARFMAEADARNASDQRLSLPTLLLELAERAKDLLAYPLRVIPENMQGIVELITVNPAGYVWFMGWMNKGHLLEFSAVIADRGKIACGVALLCYDRPDLQSNACGIVGVIASDWQPNTLSQDFTLFFGKDARLCFRLHQPLRVVSATEFITEFDHIRAGCRNDRRGPAIERMLNGLEHWSQTHVASQGFVAYASVDRLLLIPGFGYLAEGWVISPAKRVDRLQLRVEGKILRCATETLYHKPRPDLLDAYPGQGILARNAGFVACFLGEVTSQDVSDPILKITFEDGGTWNQSIATDVVSQLGHSAGLDALRLFYPTVEYEPFFPRLALNLLPTGLGNPLRTHALAPVMTVAILVLPQDRCDLVLLFDDIAQHCGDSDFGIALVASASTGRADIVRLFGDLARTFPNKASLFFVEDGTPSLDLIAPILDATRAKRFLFVGPAVFLSESGWMAAAQALNRQSGLELFEIAMESWQSEETTDIALSLCFAWSSNAVTPWRTRTPRVLGGFYRDNGLLTWQPDAIRHREAARITRTSQITPLEAAVNALVLEPLDA